jgi:hypothetical protein
VPWAAPQAPARPAYAPAPAGTFAHLKDKSDKLRKEERVNGWAYIVSGAAALAISLPAYYLSDDIFAKTIYSVGQTIGVGAIGYGSYLVLIDDDYSRITRLIESVPELSESERNRLAQSFFRENSQRARNVRKIRVISHALTAGLNLSSGLTASQRELKTALFFIGGINALAAVSFGLSRSDEEKLGDQFAAGEGALELALSPLPGNTSLGLVYRF